MRHHCVRPFFSSLFLMSLYDSSLSLSFVYIKVLYLVMVGMWTAYELPDRISLVSTPLDAKELAGIAVDTSTIQSLLQASPSFMAPCVEILKKLASAHTMIAVTLTYVLINLTIMLHSNRYISFYYHFPSGVVSLQAGRHYSTD